MTKMINWRKVPLRPLLLPPALGLAPAGAFVLGLLALAPAGAGRHPVVAASLVGAASLLAAWGGGLCLWARARGRRLTLEIDPRPQHYVQACAQASVFLYWGWHWPPVRDAAVLVAAQLLFAYAFDLLLAWSRGEAGRLGFGPVPVVFSINLFLWFADDRFHLQLLLVAFAFAAKALIRWERDGRRTHVFNPAAFALAVFSAALLATGTSDLTRGQDIAVSQFFPPHMYLWIFLVALPGQYLFGVTSMTLAAVAATWLFGLAWFTATGVYYFYDAYIPVAVFLGMHLLFTDPSTAPRTAAGRLLFGALYGAGVVAGYALLAGAGLPTFYDKLLPVPLLNLSVGWLDRLARSRVLRRLDPAGSAVLAAAGRRPAAVPGPPAAVAAVGGAPRVPAPRRRHLAYMAAWAAVFAVMSATGGVGDRHPASGCRSGRRPAPATAPARAATSRPACRATARPARAGRATRPACSSRTRPEAAAAADDPGPPGGVRRLVRRGAASWGSSPRAGTSAGPPPLPGPFERAPPGPRRLAHRPQGQQGADRRPRSRRPPRAGLPPGLGGDLRARGLTGDLRARGLTPLAAAGRVRASRTP